MEILQTPATESSRLVLPNRTLTQWMAFTLFANELIPADAGFYAIANECITDGEFQFEGSQEWHDWNSDYDSLLARYNNTQDAWEPEQFVPGEIREAQQKFVELRESLTSTIMRERGQDGMADLYLNDRPEFERRYQAGRAHFYGAEEIHHA